MTDADEYVVATVDDERRNVDEREDVAHVERENSLELCAGDTRRRTEALDPCPPVHDTGSVGDRRAETKGVDAGAPLPFEHVEVLVVHVVRQSGGVVVGTGEPRVPVDDHERVHPLRMLRGGHESHLRPESVSDEARTFEAGGVHDRDADRASSS